MQALMETSHATLQRPHRRPVLHSYDPSEESSLYHWLELSRLVEEADISAEDRESLPADEIEKDPRETMSEVEPATTYQHLAGNVV